MVEVESINCTAQTVQQVGNEFATDESQPKGQASQFKEAIRKEKILN